MTESRVTDKATESSVFDWDQPSPRAAYAKVAVALLRERGLILAITAFATAIAVVVAVVREPSYSSSAQFFPEGQRPPTGAAGAIATQLGMSLPNVDALNSPLIYPDIIGTPAFLQRIAQAKYLPAGASDSVSLVELYGGSAESPGLRQAEAVARLSRSINVSPAVRSGIVTLTARAGDPQLAHQIAERVLYEVRQFNLVRRQSRARAERLFVERRLDEMRSELRETEDRIQAFLQQNRDFSRAPELALAYSRMERQATLQRALYTSLAQSYEQAKIEEVRDTPVFTVLSPPELPLWADAGGRVRLVISGIVAGLLVGALVAYVRHRRVTSNAPETEELRATIKEIGADIRRGHVVSALLGTGKRAS